MTGSSRSALTGGEENDFDSQRQSTWAGLSRQEHPGEDTAACGGGRGPRHGRSPSNVRSHQLPKSPVRHRSPRAGAASGPPATLTPALRAGLLLVLPPLLPHGSPGLAVRSAS